MITILPVDGGTRPVIQRAHVPGMDRLTWVEADCEEPTTQDRKEYEINENMRATSAQTIAPWPAPVTYHMPIDYTDRHKGLPVRLDSRDQYVDDVAVAPGGELYQKARALRGSIDTEDLATTEQLSMTQVQAWVNEPNDWIRLPYGNEIDGGTDLADPMRWTFHHTKNGGPFRFAVEDNLLWTPFDLSTTVGGSPAYRLICEDRILEWPWADLHEGGEYIIHLRPRRWWYSVRVVATFVFASAFEYFLTDRYVVTQHWDRPPVYPIRHDVVRTSQIVDALNDLGEPMSYDLGVAERYVSSSSAEAMRTAIGQMEIRDISYIFVVYDVSPATLYISTEIPKAGEIVCGITARDNGHEVGSTIWVEQLKDLGHLYPRTQFGTFFSEFYI